MSSNPMSLKAKIRNLAKQKHMSAQVVLQIRIQVGKGSEGDKLQSQVKKWGNSLGVHIPEALAEKAGFFDGVLVEFRTGDNNTITIQRKQSILEKLMSQVTPENIHSEIKTSSPFGDENGKTAIHP